jgi:hypothetical protein
MNHKMGETPIAAKMKDGKTRREFVKEMAGSAFVGTLVGMEAFAFEVPKTPEDKEKLVAPCGLYCGACPMYLASQEKDEQKVQVLLQQFSIRGSKTVPTNFQCDGCIGGGRVASFCRRCAMRECAENTKKVTRCADCPEFPCSKITNFKNDGMLHHAEVLDNCRKLKEVGIKEWAKREEERWSCPKCHAKIAWYDKTCSNCDAKRSDRLFPLKQG